MRVWCHMLGAPRVACGHVHEFVTIEQLLRLTITDFASARLTQSVAAYLPVSLESQMAMRCLP